MKKRLLIIAGFSFALFLVMVISIPFAVNAQYGGIGGGTKGGTGGASGFPITIGTTAIGANSTITAINGLLGLNTLCLLSSSSDIGAQINTCNTAVSGKGVVILPNATSIPMSTTASFGSGLSFHGYGKLATGINCTVASDCFLQTQNPTTNGEIANEVSGFEINGSGASNQVLWHNSGVSGQTMHDVQFNPYPGSGNAATCLEYSNDTTGQFTEGNRTYNVSLERQCTTGVLFFQNLADAQNSFGYNFFEFHVVSQGANYAVTATASASGTNTAYLYNGSLTIYGNHVGPGGGILQFLNGFSTDAALGLPNERIYIAVEENGTGAGVVVNIPASGSLIRVYGNIVNGAFNASGTSLATLYNDPTNAFFLNTDVAVDKFNGWTMPGTLTLGSLTVAAALNMNSGISSQPLWQIAASPGANQMYWAQSGTNSQAGFPLVLYGGPFAGANALRGLVIPSDAGWQFESTASGATVDTSITRNAAGIVTVGTPTSLAGGGLLTTNYNLVAARKGTFTCTGAGTITISNTTELATSDVKISLNTAGGTISTPPAMKTVTAGTGFTVLCGATDTSVYNYSIWN